MPCFDAYTTDVLPASLQSFVLHLTFLFHEVSGDTTALETFAMATL